MPNVIVLGLVGLAVLFILVIIVRPEIANARGGRIMALLALLIFPAFIGILGFEGHMERSKQTSFCLSCHLMVPYGKSLYVDDSSHVPAAHFQNSRIPRDHACYTCHTNYTIYGTYRDKMRGLVHAYKYYIGHPANPIRLYEPFNNRECLHCHLGARSFEQGVVHTADAQTMADIKSNKLSCVSSGCHDTVHDVKELDKAKFWKPVQQ